MSSPPIVKLAEPTVVRRTFARPGALSHDRGGPRERTFGRGGPPATRAELFVNGVRVGEHLGAWTPFEFDATPHLRDENELEIRCQDVVHTTNGFLPDIGVRWTGARDVEVRAEPTPPRPPAAQRSAARGTKLLVDGRPFRVRGVLHWGYYPELGHPWPDEPRMRADIEYVRSLGFNLIKFCLWIPPPLFYELCAAYGLFVWQEYPVWNVPLSDASIIPEYEAFFRNDAPYDRVILRSLTCENDRLDPDLGRTLVDRCHELIPGSLVLDNSSWLCSQRCGDFHDEHPYLHNAQWKYYGRRMAPRLTRSASQNPCGTGFQPVESVGLGTHSKPFLLGESMVVDTPREGPYDAALAVRRFQIETLARDLPDAGYVVTALRDIQTAPLGLQTIDGRPKYQPHEWRWHGDRLGPPREIPDLDATEQSRDREGEVTIGPRKGQWKCPEYTWWSPIVRVLDPDLPADLIEREAAFDLLSGRVLENVEGTRVLVEVWDVHSGTVRKLPLVIEFTTEGVRRVVSAFRHDTPAGRELWDILQARTGDAPEIGPLVGTSIVLENWRMCLDGGTGVSPVLPGSRPSWIDVKCDTPLINRGRNVFEGRATFRTEFDYPGGPRTLRCEAVGDYYEFSISSGTAKLQLCRAEAGPRDGTWDGTRDVPRNFDIDLPPGRHEIEFRVRDWRGAGGMVGPVYFAKDLNERVF